MKSFEEWCNENLSQGGGEFFIQQGEKAYIDGIAEGRRLCMEQWIKELSKVMPADFKDWHDNADEEKPIVARMVIESLKQRE